MKGDLTGRTPSVLWLAIIVGVYLLVVALAPPHPVVEAPTHTGVAVISRPSPLFLEDVRNRLELAEAAHGGTLPIGRVVLTGSSTIERWRTYTDDLLEWPTTNVGIGGSTLVQHAGSTRNLIRPLRPGAVVAYVGVNDLGVPRKRGVFDSDVGQGVQLVRIAKAYFAELREAAPGAHIYFIGMIESPLKRPVLNDLRLFNNRIRDLAKIDDTITFIDVNYALAGDDGLPSAEYFSDGLHLNKAGYEIFAEQVRQALRAGPNP